MSIKATHDNHLDQEDAEYMAAKDYHFPYDLSDLETQLTTFTMLLSIYFGPNSQIYNAINAFINHLHFHYLDYQEQSVAGNIFGTKLIYAIDISIQHYLVGLRSTTKPLRDISMYHIQEHLMNLQNNVIHRCLTVNIPLSMLDKRSILLKKRRLAIDSSSDRSIQSRPRTNSYLTSAPSTTRTTNFGTPSLYPASITTSISSRRSQSQTQSPNIPVPAMNKRINQKWHAPPGANFGSTFYRLRDQTPKGANDTPFCINFHALGQCRRGDSCPLLHIDPRDVPGKEKEFDQFCSTVYNSTPPKNQNS